MLEKIPKNSPSKVKYALFELNLENCTPEVVHGVSDKYQVYVVKMVHFNISPVLHLQSQSFKIRAGPSHFPELDLDVLMSNLTAAAAFTDIHAAAAAKVLV